LKKPSFYKSINHSSITFSSYFISNNSSLISSFIYFFNYYSTILLVFTNLTPSINPYNVETCLVILHVKHIFLKKICFRINFVNHKTHAQIIIHIFIKNFNKLCNSIFKYFHININKYSNHNIYKKLYVSQFFINQSTILQ